MTKQMTKKEIAESKTMTEHEKQKLLNELREPYKAMSDEELLQLVRDFTEENGREPTRDDLVYDVILKARFGPWYRMLEKAGTRPVAESQLIKEQEYLSLFPALAVSYYSNRKGLKAELGSDRLLGVPLETYILMLYK